MKTKKNIKTFSQHLDERYGKVGSNKRSEFESKAQAFAIGEIIRMERKQANITQEELADRIGAKKSFISRIENGHTDIQLSTLYKLIELGLGLKLNLSIE